MDAICTNKHYTPINPIFFGREQCRPHHAFGPAKRTHWLLHFVVAGKGTFTTARGTYALGSGDMFVIAPYEETVYAADGDSPWEYIWVGFSCTGELPYPLTDVLHCPSVRAVFEEISSAGVHTAGLSEFLLSRIFALFGVLLDQAESKEGYVDRAVALIHAAYVRDLSVQQIADSIGIDRSYLSTLFRQSLGISPAAYLLAHRMKRAIRLLTEEHTSITVTAHSVGYTDVYTFSKAFKRHFGVSPRAFLQSFCSESLTPSQPQ